MLILYRDIPEPDANAIMSDFDISNISISRPIMTGRIFDPPALGSRKLIGFISGYLINIFNRELKSIKIFDSKTFNSVR